MDAALPFKLITDDIAVAPQLVPEAMAELARLGFRSVIDNRPDFEGGPGQPTAAAIAAAAQAAGLEFRYLPVASAVQTAEDAAACARLLSELPRPVLMFCRSGARSARLYQLSTMV